MFSDNQNTNSQIHCDVKNCFYHEDNDSCSAKEITVGPVFANTSADTVCATFRPR